MYSWVWDHLLRTIPFRNKRPFLPPIFEPPGYHSEFLEWCSREVTGEQKDSSDVRAVWRASSITQCFLCIAGDGVWGLDRHPVPSAVHPLLCHGVSLYAFLADHFLEKQASGSCLSSFPLFLNVLFSFLSVSPSRSGHMLNWSQATHRWMEKWNVYFPPSHCLITTIIFPLASFHFQHWRLMEIVVPHL